MKIEDFVVEKNPTAGKGSIQVTRIFGSIKKDWAIILNGLPVKLIEGNSDRSQSFMARIGFRGV